MKKILSVLLICALILGGTFSSFAMDSQLISQVENIETEIIQDDENVRIVKSVSENETVIATYDKESEELKIETFDSSKKQKSSKKSTEIIKNIKAPSEENLQKVEEALNNNSFDSQDSESQSVSLGYSLQTTNYGNYGYYNIYSYARIKAGDDRLLMTISSDDFEDDYILDTYDDFCDSVDDMCLAEDVGLAAVGAETLATIAALIFAPDITATKLAAALGAIGIGGTLLTIFITWLYNASTARKYYDRIEDRI